MRFKMAYTKMWCVCREAILVFGGACCWGLCGRSSCSGRVIRTVCVLSSTQEWIPAIKRDHEALTRTRPQQQPYSDAYLSGMPAKRRKVCRGGKGKEKGEGEGHGKALFVSKADLNAFHPLLSSLSWTPVTQRRQQLRSFSHGLYSMPSRPLVQRPPQEQVWKVSV